MVNALRQAINNIQQVNKDLEEVHLTLLSLECRSDALGFRTYLNDLTLMLDSASELVRTSVRVTNLFDEPEELDLIQGYVRDYLNTMDLIGDVIERITKKVVLKDKVVACASEMIH